jgi:preprotein translocase subunit SecG
LIYLVYFVHVLVCFFLILVVLLQQGKGADLSVFGGGSTMTAFGARGAATLLHKLTVVSFIVFVLTTLTISILQSGPQGSSVMRGAAPATPAPASTPAEPPADATAPPPETTAPAADPAEPPAQP